MTTQFSKGDMVQSTVNAQGMQKGNRYEVIDIETTSNFTGTYVGYKLRRQELGMGSEGNSFWIGNGHLLLQKVDEPAEPKRFVVVLDSEGQVLTVGEFDAEDEYEIATHFADEHIQQECVVLQVLGDSLEGALRSFKYAGAISPKAAIVAKVRAQAKAVKS